MKTVLLATLILAAATLAITPAQAMADPIQCVMAPCGPQCLAFAPCSPTDRLPDLPGLPTFPVCVTDPCPPIVCDPATDTLTVNGETFRYVFTSSCGLTVTKVDDARCPAGPFIVDHQVGGLTLRHAQCTGESVPSPWACAPPSGHVVHRQVWWIDVALLVCDGGLPPIVAT